jgi:methionyl aminopeptidase
MAAARILTETGAEIFTTSPKGWHRPPYPVDAKLAA